MRRSYISPEFDKKEIYGTFNMLEESNYFGAKMLEIEDSINISTQDIVFYQRENGEQIDLSTESTMESIIYSSTMDKKTNHSLILEESQTSYNLENNTKWRLEINIEEILSNFLFSELKRYRTFEGLKTDMNIYNNVDTSIKNYIKLNILNRYKFKSIDLFISYRDLRDQNLLKHKNNWTSSVYITENKHNRYQSDINYDKSVATIYFDQEKPGSKYAFDYYFNILFEKI